MTFGELPGYVDGAPETARFHEPGGLLLSRDGHRVYVCDYHNHFIRGIDVSRKIVFTVAVPTRQTIGGVSVSLLFPYRMCFDRTTAIPDSVLFVTSDINAVSRLQLPESPSDVLRYRIKAPSDDTVWRSLIRDVWSIVAEYAAEPASLSTISEIDATSVHGIAMVPSGHLLLGTETALLSLHLSLGEETIVAVAGSKTVTGFMDGAGLSARFHVLDAIDVDDTRRCAYIADRENSAIRCVKLPSSMF